MLVIPHVAPEVFRAHPTYLELDELRDQDSNPEHQRKELINILLMASAWADAFCDLGPDQTLAAHTHIENARLRLDRNGRLILHPQQVPVTGLVSMKYGYTPSNTVTLNDLTQVWIEKQRHIVVHNLGWSGGAGTLEFGPGLNGGELYTTWTYTVGYANTVLNAAATTGATVLTVADPTGLAAGTRIRLWEPGAEQTVTIANSYTPGSPTVPLTAALENDQPKGAQVSAMPIEVHSAVILYAVGMLEAAAGTGDSGSAPGARVPTSTGAGGVAASGSVAQAEELLAPFVRVR